jgi:uncharacterized protein YndB with AHSA1/START domain
MNATLNTGDGNSVLRLERRLAHPVEKVWRAVTDPAEMRHWFPATVELDPRAGGAMRFTFPGGEMEPVDGVVTELDPPRVFAFIWNGEPLRIELSPLGPGGEDTLLVFTHTFTDRPMAGSFATGWDTCLGALEQTLADPAAEVSIAPVRYAERHDAYVEAFGLGEGTTDEHTGGFTIRFERLLPPPAEKVWALLTEPPGEPAAGGTPPAGITSEHLTAGALTEAREREVLEYDWTSGGEGGEPAGRVRWELTGGHPAGTRVVVTQTGPARLAGDRPRALAAWHLRLDLIAGRLRGQAGGRPDERAAELEKHYAERVEAR